MANTVTVRPATGVCTPVAAEIYVRKSPSNVVAGIFTYCRCLFAMPHLRPPRSGVSARSTWVTARQSDPVRAMPRRR